MSSSDSDPKKATELMNEIQAVLAGGQQERERRIGLIPDIQARMDALVEKVGKIRSDTYNQYGLSYDQYSMIGYKWREANNKLQISGVNNNPVLPDPDRASILLDEITAMIPDEQSFTPEQEILSRMLSGKNAWYAKVIHVRGGRIAEYYSSSDPTEIIQNPSAIPIGGSGRSLAVQGSRLVFFYGSGSQGGSWKLEDGDYIVGRDANVFLRVEEKKDAPNGFRALAIIEPTFEEPEEYIRQGESRPYYEESPTGTASEKIGTGVFASLIGKLTGKQEEKSEKSAPAAPVVREEPTPVEKEKMTEELRSTFMSDLANSRFFLDSVRAVPEPDKKDENAGKISKVRARAIELKRNLNIVEQELATTDDAARARGKVAEIVKRAERAAEEISRFQNGREDWVKRFKLFMSRIAEIAKAQDVGLDNSTIDKIKPKAAELARRKGEIADLDGEAESIIIDSI